MLFIGNIIRRRIPIFRKLMFPTAIIAGFIGLGVKYLIWGLNINIDGNSIITNSFLQSITYHAIALGFIAMGLKTIRRTNDDNKLIGKPFKSGLVIVSTYLLQGVIGVTVSLVLSLFFSDMVRYAGLLLPFGFGQGPGQAGNIGTTFESLGFIGGNTFGLSIATIGVVWACVIGIFYINKYAKNKRVIKSDEITEVTKDVVEYSDEIPVSEAIDKMSIQIIFVILTYFASYLFMYFLTSLIKVEAITGLIWGFNFIFGMLFALIFKNISKWLRSKKVVVRRYTNNYMLNRITGVVFDFLIISSIMAIDVSKLANMQLWLTLVIMTTLGIIATYFYLRLVIKRNYKGYEHEAFAVFFGNLTGTASNGIALLREIDPNFETPASDDLVTGTSTAVLFGAPLLIITGTISSGSNLVFWLSFIALLIFFTLFFYLLMRKDKVKIKE